MRCFGSWVLIMLGLLFRVWLSSSWWLMVRLKKILVVSCLWIRCGIGSESLVVLLVVRCVDLVMGWIGVVIGLLWMKVCCGWCV